MTHKVNVWLVLNMATITSRSFLAGSNAPPSPVSFALAPVEALAPCDIPHLPCIPLTMLLAQLCSLCWTSVPASPADTIALAVHQAVWARLFPGRGGSAAFRSSEEGKQTSQLQEMLELVAALSYGYLSLAASVCAGSPCHQPAAWSPFFPLSTPALL